MQNFCLNCGKEMSEGVKFCPECGLVDGAATDVTEAAGEENAARLAWTAYITPFRNLYVAIQFALALLATMGIMTVLISVFTGEIYLSIMVAAVGVGIIAALTPLGALIHLMIIGGKELYIITDNGVWRGPVKHAPEMLSGGFSAMGISALLSGNFSMAGTAMLAAGRVQQDMAWRDVKKVVYKPNWRLIILKADALTKIWMFCTKDNYPEVEKLVKQYI
ncbi:MAG: zinc ribbon domain-containing protein [Synergistaceae bacterium]|nr:zinc ribbon domain-containing protein [Synergistaceae bacterium]